MVGDFNGDGIPDIATVNYTGDVTVLIGNGTGGFSSVAGGIPVAFAPGSIAAGDFNGDGILDLVTASNDSAVGNITVLLGGLAPTASVLSTTSPPTAAFGQSVPLSLAVSETGTALQHAYGYCDILRRCDGSRCRDPDRESVFIQRVESGSRQPHPDCDLQWRFPKFRFHQQHPHYPGQPGSTDHHIWSAQRRYPARFGLRPDGDGQFRSDSGLRIHNGECVHGQRDHCYSPGRRHLFDHGIAGG